MPRCHWGLVACVSSAIASPPVCPTETPDWCQVDASITGSILEIPKDRMAEMNSKLSNCLAGCELAPRCLYGTFENSVCGWIGRPGIEGAKETTVNNAYWFLQTQQPTSVPKRIKDGSLTKVPLGDGPLSEEQCKGALVEALQAGLVTINYGEWDGTSGGREKMNFALADAKNGKGDVTVIVKYNKAQNVVHANHSLSLGGDQPGCTQGGADGVYIVSKVGDAVKLVHLEDETDLKDSMLWSYSGDNLSPQDGSPQKCVARKDGQVKRNTEAHLETMNVGFPSPCTSTTNQPFDSYWMYSFEDSGAPFAMGPCAADDAIPMLYRKQRNGDLKQCADAPDPSDHNSIQCGKYSMAKPPSKGGLWSRRPDDDNHNCFGFTSTTTTPPPTTSHAPSPTPTTCDFCESSGLKCCGEGIHAFCYNPEYNQCCEAIAEPFEVKVVCALEQQCHPGCLPYGWGKEVDETTDVSELTLEQAVTSPAVEELEELPICHGIGLAFAVCTAGTKCCGRGTSIDPACYYEEWNECCQPPGSDVSIICAKGQGCAETNGVPFCVDSFDACRACEGQFEPGHNTYLCHVYESGTCYHAADPTSCKRVFGESATFCYGVLGSPVETSELEFV